MLEGDARGAHSSANTALLPPGLGRCMLERENKDNVNNGKRRGAFFLLPIMAICLLENPVSIPISLLSQTHDPSNA